MIWILFLPPSRREPFPTILDEEEAAEVAMGDSERIFFFVNITTEI